VGDAKRVRVDEAVEEGDAGGAVGDEGGDGEALHGGLGVGEDDRLVGASEGEANLEFLGGGGALVERENSIFPARVSRSPSVVNSEYNPSFISFK
jgi:hypothetical protein